MSSSLTDSSPYRLNPNARSSEMKNPIRRSFSGNPFFKPSLITKPRGFNSTTPANSPSDFMRRNSFSRESVDGKENGNDQNLRTVKDRPPAASKGSKNFMSPTISTASKVTASPKKKILVERNEPVRTSVASPYGKGPHSVRFSDFVKVIGSDQEMDLNQKVIGDGFDTSRRASLEYEDIASDDVVTDSVLMDDSLLETVIDEPEEIDMTLKFYLVPPSPHPLAPLDADPYVPPYDPKTNFLSPRPQFLHYKPNPKTEVYQGTEREVMRFEDRFLTAHSFHTEVTEERQTENFSDAEMMKEEEELDVSPPAPISTSLSKEIAIDKMESKQHLVRRWKALAVVVLLLFVGFSVSVIGPSVLKDSSFFKLFDPSKLSDFAEINLYTLAQNSQVWIAKFLPYMSILIYDIEVYSLGPVRYSNLTDWHEDQLVGGHPLFIQKDYGAEEKFGQDVLGSFLEIETEDEQCEGEGSLDIKEYVGIEADDNGEEVLEEENYDHDNGGQDLAEENYCDQEEVHSAVEAEVPVTEAEKYQESVDYDLQKDFMGESIGISQAPFISPEVSKTEALRDENDSHYDSETENLESSELDDSFVEPLISGCKEESIEISLSPLMQQEVSETEKLWVEDDIMHYGSETDSMKDESLERSELNDASVESPSSETMNNLQEGSENKVSMKSLVGLSVLVLALSAAAAYFFYMKKAKAVAPSAASTVNQPLTIISLKSESFEHALSERLSSRNWPTELDMIGEPCPSEMSSLQKTSSNGKRELKVVSSKVQSDERKVRNKRESLASSSDFSMISPSYGSFTTHEKMSKHRLADEEVVTPVRRSSRIRKHVISP